MILEIAAGYGIIRFLNDAAALHERRKQARREALARSLMGHPGAAVQPAQPGYYEAPYSPQDTERAPRKNMGWGAPVEETDFEVAIRGQTRRYG